MCSRAALTRAQPLLFLGVVMLGGSGRLTTSLMYVTCVRQVYLSLLRMYLSPPSVHCLGPIKLELLEPQANLQAALQVLELHHSKLDTTKVRSSSGEMKGTWGHTQERTGQRKGLRLESCVASDFSGSLLFCLTRFPSLFLSLGHQPSTSKHSN